MERRWSTRSKQREKMKAEGPRGRRAGRPAHHRHRAARGPPHRPAASRPLRPPGRSRQQPLLPVAGRRPDADLRRRVGQEHAHPAGHAGRRGDRKPDGPRRIEGAQKKVEERNFEIRKNLLEYDEVMDEQRKRVYGYRQRILDGVNCRDLILEMIDKQVDEHLDALPRPRLRHRDRSPRAAGNLLHVAARRHATSAALDFDDAERHRPRRSRAAWPKSQVLDAIEENLPEDEDAERMELGGAGQAGQHPLGPQPPRPRPEEDRPRRIWPRC